MKLRSTRFILAFRDGNRVVWGVPDFMTEEEGQGFLEYLELELKNGANNYFSTCCSVNLADDQSGGGNGLMSMNLKPSLMPRASHKTATMLKHIENLIDQGRRSLKRKREIKDEQLSIRLLDAEFNQSYRGMGCGK